MVKTKPHSRLYLNYPDKNTAENFHCYSYDVKQDHIIKTNRGKGRLKLVQSSSQS